MIDSYKYKMLSLELHLFFARIMKEHSFFLEAGFMEKDESFKNAARKFQIEFGQVLYKVIDLANGNISNEVLASEELFTNNTLKSEKVTEDASGLYIDENITIKELNLKNGNSYFRESSDVDIHHLNEHVLNLLNQIIHFKKCVLNRVLECKMFTVNYPLLLRHIIREAEMYKDTLVKLQRKKDIDLYEQELFWNRQMMEHAEFVRGLLDPTEEKLMATADKIANEYKHIIENCSNDPTNLTAISLQETIALKNFKEAGNDGILNCKIKSIIIPLLADHVLREANHYIRVMKNHHKENKINYYQ